MSTDLPPPVYPLGVLEVPERRLPSDHLTPGDTTLLAMLRAALQAAAPDWEALRVAVAGAQGFRQRCDRVVLILYQASEQRLMVVRRGGGGLGEALEQALKALKQHPRIGAFAVADQERCRIQLDIIAQPPVPCDIREIGMSRRGALHFEVGLDGLVLERDGKRIYVLPGDAYVHSYMGMKQLRRRLTRLYGNDVLDAYSFARFTSESYISFGERWVRLWRGHPLNGPLTQARLVQATELAVDHILRNQQADGRFLYYYNAALDSRRDHEHPNRDPDRNPFYNIVRHSGGILTGLYHARLTGSDRALAPMRRAIDYLLAQARTYETHDGREAHYIYYNRKGKLGGSGVGLYALAEHRRLTGDRRYDEAARRLANHIAEQITDSGEFIYYKVYLDKEVTEADNGKYFSFYYPGEALCGLAGYYLYILEDEVEKARLLAAVHRALRFLIVERPRTRASEYRALPSDAWLMMAMMEFWDEPAFRRDLYRDFVFTDADAMVRQMYTVDDAPYPDYAGAFFYEFGEYPYADGARAEGLMAAFTLAHKVGDKARIALYGRALRLLAWATMHLVNTPESIYFAANPDVALGGIRFKYTRQWFRIDTIQHVCAFYLKMMLDGRVAVSDGTTASNEERATCIFADERSA
ncbi:hypothetical protein [Halochromatium roseum]|uniref:hypothetical protein n=1 Tax=Halochromatium roseum TaxID=391920 RepID=UPI001911C33D|nr:hypothetical protein [Halochromatium roseum]MBK5941225.1 hypothetical protein [Halochromatium roseum]